MDDKEKLMIARASLLAIDELLYLYVADQSFLVDVSALNEIRDSIIGTLEQIK